MEMLKKLDEKKELKEQKSFKSILKLLTEVHWNTVLLGLYINIGGAIGFYQIITGQWKFWTAIWTLVNFLLGSIGLTIGAHRLFSHRSFKATRGLKNFLIYCNTLAGQRSVITWAQAHRTHHRYMDSDKDPTNINKGVVFSHFGFAFWWSPVVNAAMDTVDISDLTNDKDIKFQYDYYVPLHIVITHLIPVLVPCYFWNESLWISIIANAFRYITNYNQVGTANTILHIYGTRPYDKRITPRENLYIVAYTLGEGYHNYHHVFPWDYKSAEYGDIWHFNINAIIIDFFYKLGWVSDRKVVSKEVIAKRKARTGDGTHLPRKPDKKDPTWGDRDVDVDDYMDIHVYYKDDYFKEL